MGLKSTITLLIFIKLGSHATSIYLLLQKIVKLSDSWGFTRAVGRWKFTVSRSDECGEEQRFMRLGVFCPFTCRDVCVWTSWVKVKLFKNEECSAMPAFTAHLALEIFGLRDIARDAHLFLLGINYLPLNRQMSGEGLVHKRNFVPLLLTTLSSVGVTEGKKKTV